MLARLNCYGHKSPPWIKNWLWTLGQTNAVCLSTATACRVSSWAVISSSRDLKIPMEFQQQPCMSESHPSSKDKLLWRNLSLWPNLTLLLLDSCIWQVSISISEQKHQKQFHSSPFSYPFTLLSTPFLLLSSGKIPRTQTPYKPPGDLAMRKVLD